MADEEIRVAYKPLAELARWHRNPKNHDLDKIKGSIRHHGFVQPLVEDGTTDRLVAGHGRLEALLAMQAAGEAPPRRIKLLPDGGWAAPVVTGVSFATEAEAEAYLVADNHLVEVGGWDDRALSEMLKDLATNDPVAFQGSGFDESQLAALVMVTRPASEIKDLNEAAEWVGMPEYDAGSNPIQLVIAFPSEAERDQFIEQNQMRVMKRLGTTWSTRWPIAEINDVGGLKFEAAE